VTDAAGLTEAVRELSPTVVIDPLGAGFTPAALAALAPRGRHVILGTSAGAQAELQLQSLYRNAQRILGYGGLGLSDDERRSGLEAAIGGLAEGRLRIPIDRVLPLEQVDDAFTALTDRAVTGKVLLDLSG
jgi:NADPH2:quinone reductase